MRPDKRAWLIYDKERLAKAAGYYERYIKYLNEYGFEVKLIIIEEINYNNGFLYQNKELSAPDVAIMRTVNAKLSLALEDSGALVFNNSIIADCCNNKQKTYEVISSNGIAIPETFFLNKTNYKCMLDNIQFPVVLKSLYGHGGDEVFWLNNKKELNQYINQIREKEFILQKPVSELGKDLRVYVIGETIIAAMLRHNANDFKSNFCLGGKALKYNLNEKEIETIRKIIALFDFGLVGIDFMFDNGELVFNEIEDVVGARMLYQYTDIDIVKLYAKHICKKTLH